MPCEPMATDSPTLLMIGVHTCILTRRCMLLRRQATRRSFGGLALMLLLDTSILTRLRQPSILLRKEELDGFRPRTHDLDRPQDRILGVEGRRMGSALPLHSERSVESTPKQITSTAPVKFSATSSPTGLRDARCPLLIAAAAEIASLTVLHYDADFDHIAAMTRRPTQWIVERGSIDRSPPHDRCTEHLKTSPITRRRIIAFDKPGPA